MPHTYTARAPPAPPRRRAAAEPRDRPAREAQALSRIPELTHRGCHAAGQGPPRAPDVAVAPPCAARMGRRAPPRCPPRSRAILAERLPRRTAARAQTVLPPCWPRRARRPTHLEQVDQQVRVLLQVERDRLVVHLPIRHLRRARPVSRRGAAPCNSTTLGPGRPAKDVVRRCAACFAGQGEGQGQQCGACTLNSPVQGTLPHAGLYPTPYRVFARALTATSLNWTCSQAAGECAIMTSAALSYSSYATYRNTSSRQWCCSSHARMRRGMLSRALNSFRCSINLFDLYLAYRMPARAVARRRSGGA